jgi:hypothetical protein
MYYDVYKYLDYINANLLEFYVEIIILLWLPCMVKPECLIFYIK